MKKSLTFFCVGTPIGQGSKRVVRGLLIEDSKHSRPWRQAIVHEALAATENGVVTFHDAVRVEAIFYFRRPGAHFGTGRNAAVLKVNAPDFKTSKPDIDKLLRALLDALEIGGVIQDDRQVASVAAIKKYVVAGRPEGVQVMVSEVS